MKTIIIALDYSPNAETVAKTGYELAKVMNTRTILLHVVTDPNYYASLKYSPIFGFDNFSSINLIQADTDEQLEVASYKYLEKVKRVLGDATIETVVKNGESGDTILSAATELNADILVMGTHSRSGFEKILLGSVTENVLRNSLIPVFIIPIKTIEQTDKDKIKK